MGSSEEYLDKLLQSVSNEEKITEPEKQSEKKMNTDMTDDELLASLIDMYSEELAEYKTEEIIHKEDTLSDMDIADTTDILDDVEEGDISDVSDNPEEADTSDAEAMDGDVFIPDHNEMMSQEDIEALLNSLNTSEEDDMLQTENAVNGENSENTDSIENTENTENSEFLLKQMGIDDMSQEQIEELLNAASKEEVPENTKDNNEEMDLDALFGGLHFSDDFDLGKGENTLINEPDIGGNDLLNELFSLDAEEPEKGMDNTEKTENKEAAEETVNPENEKKVTGEEKKKKKEKITKEKKEKPAKEKKDGENFFKKIISAFFEDEDDMEQGDVIRVKSDIHKADMPLSGENEEILTELMNEDMLAGKKDKKKKNKKKTGANAGSNNQEESEDEEIKTDPKEKAKLEKKKKKDEKKAAKKKEKEKKAEEDRAFLKAQPSISTKRAMTAFLFAFSILAVILLVYHFVPDALDKAGARKAFYAKNYYEAYELLQGKELSDSDTILLNKVTYILKLQRKLDSYNNYVKMGKETEALNALVEGVGIYEKNYTYAKALSVDEVCDAIYNEILIILNGKYGIDENMAKEILSSDTEKEYTLRLMYALEGKTWSDTKKAEEEKPMEDVLPEEKDFLEGQMK